MAEANGRMNGSRCFPAPALCLSFPALQACTEELPLVLQRPDSFPLVMGILQEINHEKVGCPSRVDNTFIVLQRPPDQHVQTIGLSNVKLENSDLEENHHYSYDTNAELCQEWSLKGVEEMLADSEELQLRHDSYQQAHVAAANLELASTQDVKLLFGLQSTQFEFRTLASDEAELLVDEKPPPCSELLNSLQEQVPSQGRASLVEEPSEVKPTLFELHAALPANNKRHHQSSQAFAEERMGVDTLKVVKREPDGNALCDEEQLQVGCYLRHASTPMSSDVVLEGKNTAACIVPQQIKSKIASNADAELHNSEKTAGLTHNIQVRKSHSCGSPEKGGAHLKPKDIMPISSDDGLIKHRKILSSGSLESNLDTERKKQQIVHDIKRTTSAILVLPADFTEQEKIQVPQSPTSTSNSLAAEEPNEIQFSSEGRGGGTSQADFPEAELDDRELTLSLGSSQPETAGSCPRNLECIDFPDEKPAVKTSSVQDENDTHCQRTNPSQWQHVTRSGHNVSTSSKEPLWPPTDGRNCYTDGGTSSKVVRYLSKSFDFYGSSSEEAPDKKRPLKKGQRSSRVGKPIKLRKLCSDGGVSRHVLQSMPRGSEDGSSALDGEEERLSSENDQLAGPNEKIVKDSSNVQPCQVSLQSAQASDFNGPHKKRMRGILPIEEEGDGGQKEKDTRCHRSDGKSWRCARECINGAYYCQYHLRARRIGYNRRKNGDTATHHLESVSKMSSKIGKKSRQLLSTAKRNNKL